MRIRAVVKRICRQMFHDKRTLALLLVAPLVVLSLLYVVFNGEEEKLSLAATGVPDRVIEQMEAQDMVVKEYDTITVQMIEEEDLDGALLKEGDEFELLLLNDDPARAKRLELMVKQQLAKFVQSEKIPPELAANMNQGEFSLDKRYVYGDEDTAFFDVMSPMLISFFAFFFVFLISGIGLLRERTTGTLERLLATPIRRGEVVIGYLLGYGLFAVLQMVVILFFSIWLFDLVVVGSIWTVLLVSLLLALVALTLGLLLSTFASSEFQMVQFIPLVVVPQVFFSGIFPLDGMADWFLAIAAIMPLSYAAEALKSVMYQGFTLADIWLDLLILLMFALVFIVLNLLALKKHRAL